MGICVLTSPLCNFETDFPEILGQIHIAFNVLESFGTQKTMHCGIFSIGRQGTHMEFVMPLTSGAFLHECSSLWYA